MTETQLAEIETRMNAATVGPWITYHAEGDWYVEGDGDNEQRPVMVIAPEGEIAPVDADFIACARADVPALIAEVRRMRPVVEAAVALIEKWSAAHRIGNWPLRDAVRAYKERA